MKDPKITTEDEEFDLSGTLDVVDDQPEPVRRNEYERNRHNYKVRKGIEEYFERRRMRDILDEDDY